MKDYTKIFKVEGNSISLVSTMISIVAEKDFDVLFAEPPLEMALDVTAGSDGDGADGGGGVDGKAGDAAASLADELIKEVFGCYYEFNDRYVQPLLWS